MDETVTVRRVALGSLSQSFHVTVTSGDYVLSVPLRHSDSLIGAATVFIIILLTTSLCQHGSKWCFADCCSHGRQPWIAKSADFTLPLPLKLHSYFHAGLTCYLRHCSVAFLSTTVICFLCYYCYYANVCNYTDSCSVPLYTVFLF